MEVLCRVFLSGVVLAPPAAAGVWEVGSGGLATIGDAIALATDGDIVLVHAGTYPAFTVSAKSLVIAADAGESVVVVGTVLISGLAAGQPVTLQGLKLEGDPTQPGVRATQNDGAVWIEACAVTSGVANSGAGPALAAESCSSLVLRRSTFEGGAGGYDFGGPGGDGVVLHGCSAAVFACSLRGGDGGWGGDAFGCTGDDGASGGSALVVQDCVTLLHEGFVKGGPGGPGDLCKSLMGCGFGGSGGTGIVSAGASQTTYVRTLLLGGEGGGGSFPCFPGTPGAPGKLLGGAVTAVVTLPRGPEASSPLREGQTAIAFASGEPSELLALYAGLEPAHLPLPSLFGLQLVQAPLLLFGPAVVPKTGELQFQAAVPELGAAVTGMALRLQVVSLPPGGGFVLGEAATLVLLDAGL